MTSALCPTCFQVSSRFDGCDKFANDSNMGLRGHALNNLCLLAPMVSLVALEDATKRHQLKHVLHQSMHLRVALDWTTALHVERWMWTKCETRRCNANIGYRRYSCILVMTCECIALFWL